MSLVDGTTLSLLAYTIGLVIGVGLYALLVDIGFWFDRWRVRKGSKKALKEFQEWKANLVYGELPPWSEEYKK